MMRGGAQRQLVADCAEPGDRADGDVGEVGVMAEGFPRLHVTQVHFDERDLHRQQRVAQRDAGVRERRRVEDDEGDVRRRRLVNARDQLVLGVALERRQVMAGLRRQLTEPRDDLLQRDGAIQPRLASAEQVQVGAVEEQKVGHEPVLILRLPETTSTQMAASLTRLPAIWR